MALITLAEAARLTGKNASTITRAVQKGKVSCNIDNNGQRVFDPAELERAFGKLQNIEVDKSASMSANALESASLHDEIKRLHEREVALVREKVQLMQSQIEDLQKDRDHWRQQATHLIEDKRNNEQEQAPQEAAISDAEAKLERVRRSWFGRVLFKV